MVGQQGRGEEGGGPGVCPVLYTARPEAWERWSVSGEHMRETHGIKKKTTWAKKKKGHTRTRAQHPSERERNGLLDRRCGPPPQDGYPKFIMVREGVEIADQLDMALMHDIICLGQPSA